MDMKHKIITGSIKNVGPSKPIGKEWVEKMNKHRIKKEKK
jgi:hypothetical protein